MGNGRRNVLVGVGVIAVMVCLVVGYRIVQTTRTTMQAASQMSAAPDRAGQPDQPTLQAPAPTAAPLPAPKRRKRRIEQGKRVPGDGGPIRLERALPPNLKSKLIRRFDGDVRLQKEQLLRAKRIPLGGRADLRPGARGGFEQRGERIPQDADDGEPALAIPVDEQGEVLTPPTLEPGDLDTGEP